MYLCPLSQIKKLASRSPHREICGIITQEGRVIPITNIAKVNSTFVMEKFEYIRAINNNTIAAIYHSHVNQDSEPSEEDVASCKRTKYPYLIVTPKDYHWLEP